MDCRDISELLIPYLDGELGEEEREAVELHLSGCLHCRKELEALSTTQSKLRQGFEAVASKTPSVQAWTRLQQRLAAEEQSRVTIFNRAKSKLSRGIDAVKGGLVFQQPVWKAALAGALVAALITGLALIVPPYLGQPQEVLAAEIAQNDPQVKDLLPEGTVIRVVKAVRPVEKGIFHVLFLIPGESIWEEDGNKAVMINVLVDVRERKVAEVRALRIEAAHIAPLTEAEKEKAIEIAKADSRVQEILDSGAEIHTVIPLPFFQPSGSSLTVKVVGVVLIAPSSDSEVEIERWMVHVDLIEEKVVKCSRMPLARTIEKSKPTG